MKVINIPAYTSFTGNSYRTDIYLLTDTALLQRLKAEHPTGGNIWSASGGTYNNLAVRCNELLGSPVFNSTAKLIQVYNKSHTINLDYFLRLSSLIGFQLDAIKIVDSYDLPTSSNISVRPKALNNDELRMMLGNGNGNSASYYTFYNSYSNDRISFSATTTTNTLTGTANVCILPDNIFTKDGLISREAFIAQNITPYDIQLRFTVKIQDGELSDVTSFILSCGDKGIADTWTHLNSMFGTFSPKNSGMNFREFDPENPYGVDGNSGMGGGDGTLNARGLDAVDPAEVPALPSISAANLGFMTMYNPSASQLRQLSDFMWSNLFDLNTYKKLFSDPMESIIGLAVVPINPTTGGSKTVKFGTIDSGIEMNYLSTNWCSLDCGWCSIEKYIGAFLDSDPYTKVSIYLPFIGIRQLSADDVNGRMVHVVYHVDVLTGACAAFIEVEGRGVLYTYNGSCITNIPLTSVNFSGAIQNAVSAVISGIGTVAGMATGAAPITAMGITGLMNSAANTALNSKPAIQRSGNLGGSAGIMSIMKPYLIIERPDISVPYNVQHFAGQTCNITMRLDSCSGFTVCEFIHLEDVPATTEEISEIESLLAQGVYL